MKKEENNLVTILNTTALHEVQIAKDQLAIEGINSFLADQYATSTIGTSFSDGYRLQVNATDVDKAKQILQSIFE